MTVDFMMAAWMGLISDGGVVLAADQPEGSLVPWMPLSDQYRSGYEYDWLATLEAHDWMVRHGVDLASTMSTIGEFQSRFSAVSAVVAAVFVMAVLVVMSTV